MVFTSMLFEAEKPSPTVRNDNKIHIYITDSCLNVKHYNDSPKRAWYDFYIHYDVTFAKLMRNLL